MAEGKDASYEPAATKDADVSTTDAEVSDVDVEVSDVHETSMAFKVVGGWVTAGVCASIPAWLPSSMDVMDTLLIPAGITTLLFIVYAVPSFVINGPKKVLSYRDELQGRPWMGRAQAAHSNLVENLAPFTLTVFAATQLVYMDGSSSRISTLKTLAAVWLGARLAHYPATLFTPPVLRTLCFLVNSAAAIGMGVVGLQANPASEVSFVLKLCLVIAMWTGLLFTIYIFPILYVNGPVKVLCYKPGLEVADWMKRAQAAHNNMSENLPPFTAAIIGAYFVLGPADFGKLANPVIVFLVARVLHLPAQISNVPVLRTVLFLIGAGAAIAVAIMALTSPAAVGAPAPLTVQLLLAIALFTMLLFTVYVVPTFLINGPKKALSYRDKLESRPWMGRAAKAHANLVENLVPFIALTFGALALGDQELVVPVIVFLAFRVVHLAVYITNTPALRTMAFIGNTGAAVAIFVKVAATGGIF